MDAIVLAGGLGTRLKDQLPGLPKCLAPINGIPFLDIFLTYWKASGVTHFYLSTGHLSENVAAHLKESPFSSMVTIVNENKPLGTGGAICHVVREMKLSHRFMIMNGDTIFRIPLEKMISFHEEKKAAITLALKSVPDNSRYGSVAVSSSGSVLAFGKTPVNKGLIYGGIAICEDPKLFSLPPSEISLENKLIPEFLHHHVPIFGKAFEGLFIDIGTPESYGESQTVLKEKS